MSLRPRAARWFELLTARDDLGPAVETLARTGAVELEVHSATTLKPVIPDLREGLAEYNRLAQRYQAFWPATPGIPADRPGRPAATLQRALERLRAWRDAAEPVIEELETDAATANNLGLVAEWLDAFPGAVNPDRLAAAGPALAARLYVLPPAARLSRLPPRVIHHMTQTRDHRFALLTGPPEEVESVAQELAVLKGRHLPLPAGMGADTQSARHGVERALRDHRERMAAARARLTTLNDAHDLTAALGDIARVEWLVTHVSGLPVSENFAWITGWTSDAGGERLTAALKSAGVRALLRFPPAPREVSAPTVLSNPWWARPFELFPRLLGNPGQEEADPSRLLAVIAPLLFGYMFGDVGHGFVLMLAGLALQRRWPGTRLLIAGGAASMVFGVLFGDVFTRADVIPALWLRPLEEPLTTLLVPLGGGVVILTLGLVLNAAEARWRGVLGHWFAVDAGALLFYLSLVAGFLDARAWYAAPVGVAWYFTGSAWLGRRAPLVSVARAGGHLMESMLQLLVNTLSFARVGAFALAHAGLAEAVTGLSHAVAAPAAALLILIVGNAVIIVLEGLVVSIQTTRLVLFEFFVRFLAGEGRVFKPLTLPREARPPAAPSESTSQQPRSVP